MYACTVMTHMSSWFGVMFRLGSSKSLSSEKICPEDNPTGIIIINNNNNNNNNNKLLIHIHVTSHPISFSISPSSSLSLHSKSL